MYRELYLITEYCKKQEEKREEARESYKAAVRQILEFEDSGLITTSEAINLISRYGDDFESVQKEYADALMSVNRLRRNLK